MPKFTTQKWNGYDFRLFHNVDNIRSIIPLIPLFWDTEVCLDMAMKAPVYKRDIDETWKYHWELRDLDDKTIKQGDDDMHVSNKGFRRKFTRYNSGKKRAIVLGDLYPNKFYKIYISFFTSEQGGSPLYLLATLTVKDRDGFHQQIFLILFTIAMTLYFSVVAKGCGL